MMAEPEIMSDEVTKCDSYAGLVKAWHHYASWRDRMFAGYVTALGALVYLGASKDATTFTRVVILCLTLLVSIVFRMLDYRTNEYVNLCQLEGEKIRGTDSLFVALNRQRFCEISPGVKYADAINLLVAVACTASLVGLADLLLGWFVMRHAWCSGLVAVGFFLGLYKFLENFGGRIYQHEKEKYRLIHAPTSAKPTP
jgi:hypothetical protein